MNVASQNMVDILKLHVKNHPQPYKIGWVNDYPYFSDQYVLV